MIEVSPWRDAVRQDVLTDAFDLVQRRVVQVQVRVQTDLLALNIKIIISYKVVVKN